MHRESYGAFLQARGRELQWPPHVHQKQASVPPAMASALPVGRPIKMVVIMWSSMKSEKPR